MMELENIGKTTKYMIHATPKRLWYVDHYLVPEMIKNGIDKNNIIVYNDDKERGNLGAFLDSLKKSDCDLWHLQDDVIISSDFKEKTEKYDNGGGVVCGFCSAYSEDCPDGFVLPENMWYSFPCIRIPYVIAMEFIDWIAHGRNGTYKNWISANKYDDSLFMAFLKEQYPLKTILNLKPNIVNHIDYLIGGSIVNPMRQRKTVSIYWDDIELLTRWELQLRREVNR